jgi:alpha-glucosidase
LSIPWWQSGIVYQIYPRSFQDSNGDGIGDLNGIASRLDHLVDLGIDAVWISPIYPSPMADFGYDVADYCGIDPIFGTLADFDRLLAEAHARGLKVILDFVPNHSSDRHPWFLESRSSRDNPKRDWYIWRDPAPDGGPPNNWLARFGGSAWDWDEATGQYYLHSFLPQQPDLDWRNPQVVATMRDVLRFWLGRGVDGFRIDVLWLMIKDDRFRDNPPNPGWQPGSHSFWRLLPEYMADRPEVHDIARGLRSVFDEYADRVMIGEIYLPVDRLMAYYGPHLDEAHLPFNFQLIGADWNAGTIAGMIQAYEAALPPGAWPNWVLGNHDQHRIASRIGRDQARIAAMLLLTLRGTPTVYYGEEIGMVDGIIPPELVRDPEEQAAPGTGTGRDPERTPMQWDGSANCGFSTGTPWLPVTQDGVTNVAAEAGDPGSMLNLYRRLIELRRAHPALSAGAIETVRAEGAILRYERVTEGQRLSVLLNFGHETQWVETSPGTLLLTTHRDRDGTPVAEWCEVRGNEGLVILIS